MVEARVEGHRDMGWGRGTLQTLVCRGGIVAGAGGGGGGGGGGGVWGAAVGAASRLCRGGGTR